MRITLPTPLSRFSRPRQVRPFSRPGTGGKPAGVTGRLLVFCLCLLFPLSFTASGCARQTEKEEASVEAGAQQIDPSSWKLSPEAEHLYYYLLLSQGLSSDSQVVVSHALKGLLKLDPSLPVYQDSATILLARGEYEAAQSTADDGLALYPGDTILIRLLAGSYSENNQPLKAVELLEEHLRQRPESVEVAEELVRLYLKTGQDKKASDLLARLPGADQSSEADLFRAGVLSTVGRYTEAKTLLGQLLARQPRLYEAWLELAYIAEREKNTDEALAAYAKAAEITPGNPDIWFRVALLELGRDNPAAALKAIDGAPPSASLFMQAALRFADFGHYAEAEALLQKSRENGGAEEELALILSMIRQESRSDPKEGLPPLESISPDSQIYPAALLQKARIYMQDGDYAKAYAAALEGRTRFPDRKELWGVEAYALVRMDKSNEAENVLKDSLGQYPNDEDLLFSLGNVQDQIGKKAEAMQTMERIIALNPKNPQALNYVGYTLADNNQELQRALTLITTALGQTPDADYIVDSLAWVQYRLGQYEEAWESINRSISLGGDDPAIWEHYGDIALALGKREEAAKGYAEALARKPINTDVLREKLIELNH